MNLGLLGFLPSLRRPSLIPDTNKPFSGLPQAAMETHGMAQGTAEGDRLARTGLVDLSAGDSCAHIGSANRQAQEHYWTECLTWSERAGIEYWKVDGGAHAQDWTFRKQLTQWARQCAPHLTIEHAVCQGSVNDENGHIRGKLVAQEADLLSASDVLHAYDILQPLSPVQTLDRVAVLLKAMEGRKANGRALINCEDECYLAAALGLCAGVMRHPLHALRCNDDWDLFFPHMVDDAKLRMDEVARIVNGQEMMQPFGAKEERVQMDERVLEDFLSFSSSQTEDSVDRPNAGSARVCAYQSWHVAARDLADLRIDLPHPVSHLAVFESYRSQRIVGTGVRQAKARDLLGSEAVSLSRCDGELTISGDTIRSIGLSGATPGDRSEPGLLITFLGGR